MLTEHTVVCPILIGRDAPLSTVHHTVARARAAQGSTLLVSGEAGIGKSRLVRAMVEHARSEGFVTLQGACFEADRAHPYAPVLDLVRVLSTTASPALAAHYFSPAAAELVMLFPELRSIFDDTPARQALDPEEERRRLFQSFTEAVHTLGKVQPLLLVIEDVHWSDDATLDLVLHMARRVGEQSIALVLTFRSDEMGPRLARLLADFDRARCASEVSLRPLGATDIAAMLRAIFGSEAALGPAFVQGLHTFTEGNPFFVEEMLKALLTEGDIVQTDGTWRARPLEHVRVPRTATEAVGRRLAGLSAAARDVASVAAVAGRRFDFTLLQSLTRHDEPQLLRLVKELVEAQLVVEETADRFAFRHALSRETIRARLLTRERVALHRAIATSLEEQANAGATDLDDALAYHLFEAGMWEPAKRFALRAADHALTLCAPREALQQLERAIIAGERAGDRPDPSLLLARGRAYETLGAFPLANENFLAGLAIARERADHRVHWAALHALGMLWAARDYQRAGDYRRDALEVARTIDDAELVAYSLNRVGNWHVNRDDPRSGIPYHDEALAIFERLDDRRGVAETVDLLAMSNHIAGDQDRAVDLYDRSVSLLAALENRRGLANALAVLAVCGPSHHASAGSARQSAHARNLRTESRAIQLATDIGWRAGEAFARYLVADHLAWVGAYPRAIRLAREALDIAEEIEHLQWQCGARRVLGVMAMDLGAEDAALAQLREAHDIARRLDSATWIRWTAAPLAIVLTRMEQHAAASAVLDDIDAVTPASEALDESTARRTLGQRYLGLARAEIALNSGDAAGAIEAIDVRDVDGTPRALLLRGQALAALGRRADASSSLVSARTAATVQDAAPLVWRIDAALGMVSLADRRRAAARQLFDAARAAAMTLAAGLEDEPLAVHFEDVVNRLAPAAPVRTAGQAAKAAHGGLTRRERDTASLIAHGKSNRAVARALGIGERTVEGYVAAALAKLAFSSRSQLAVWAAEQGLTPGGGESPRNAR